MKTERELLKERLAGICPILQSAGSPSDQDVLADFILEYRKECVTEALNEFTAPELNNRRIPTDKSSDLYKRGYDTGYRAAYRQIER